MNGNAPFTLAVLAQRFVTAALRAGVDEELWFLGWCVTTPLRAQRRVMAPVAVLFKAAGPGAACHQNSGYEFPESSAVIRLKRSTSIARSLITCNGSAS